MDSVGELGGFILGLRREGGRGTCSLNVEKGCVFLVTVCQGSDPSRGGRCRPPRPSEWEPVK